MQDTKDPKLDKFLKILEVANEDFATRDDVHDIALALIGSFTKKIEDTRQEIEQAVEEAKTSAQETDNELKGQVNDTESKVNQTMVDLGQLGRALSLLPSLLTVKKMVEEARPPEIFPQAIVNEAVQTAVSEVKGLIPPPQGPKEVRNSLESLKGEERLDKSAVKGLEGWQKGIEKQVSESKKSPNGGIVAGRDVIKTYDLSAQLDGVTTTFNLPATYLILDVRSTSFPYAFRYGVDYTTTPTTITFTSEINPAGTLAAGQTLYIIYVVA